MASHSTPPHPIALTVAGSDCCAGAGLQADLKTFHSYNVYGLTAVTAVVAQSPVKLLSYQTTPPSLLREQLECLLETYPISVVKTGALFTPEIVSVIADTLRHHDIPLFIDPVGISSTGALLGSADLISSIAELLFPMAMLVTPNLAEAQAIAENNTDDLSSLGLTLAEKYNTNFLVKGGHKKGDYATDILTTAEQQQIEFSMPRIANADYHGTGCTLAAAIASEVALQRPLHDAIYGAKTFLHNAIAEAHHWPNLSALNTFRNS